MRKTTRRRGLTTAVACLLTAAIAIPFTQTAAADDEPTQDTSADSRKAQGAAPSPVDPRIAAQAAAQGVSNEIDIAARKQGLGGFTGLRVAPDKVWLHWKGDVPAEITRIIESAPPQVEVEVVPARYSLEEFNVRARQVVAETPSGLGTKVLSAGPSRDFDRLEVGTEQPMSARAKTLLADAVDGMPLAFRVAEKSSPLFANRWDDTAPFWGGAAIGIDNFLPGGPAPTCSTGFPVDRSTTPGIISAQHCGANEEWRTPQDRLVGNSNAGDSGVDAMLLTGGESYGRRIYNSDFQADAKNSVGISSAANPAVDSFVFASGAFSGASVVRVTTVNEFRGGVGPGFITLNEQGEASIGEGDSGGPVASADPNDPANMAVAAGMVDQGLGNPAQCTQGVQGGRDCFVRTFHVNISAIESALGVTVRTE